MARNPNRSDQAARAAVDAFRRLPPRGRVAVLVLLAVGGLVWFAASRWQQEQTAPPVPPPTGANSDGSADVLFCFWNVENLFDDADDKRRSVDEEFDNRFAQDAEWRAEKYDRIASALLRMNGGRGPDVLACVEVESVRAAELLQQTLNRKLDEAKADPALRYAHVAMRNLNAGRHIAPCVISRLNIDPSATRLHGRQLRILETRLAVNGHALTVIASHWTSQLQQRDGGDGDEGRAKYAALVRDVFAEQARANPNVDLLVCGDFNDTPDSEPVARDLGATGGPSQLRNLMVGKPPAEFGTLWYGGKPLVYDHVCVSPGMLDPAGWGCDPDSVRTATDGLIRPGVTRREPWRFGSPQSEPTGGRGYSDHFPVTVRLRVGPSAAAPATP